MKLLKLLPTLLLPLFLTSCMGEEPNDIAYVTALGIDKKDGENVYTVQFANPTKISGGASEEGGKGGEIVENISVNGNSIYSGISNANALLSKNLSLAHAKLLVVSEDIAKEGLGDIIQTIARSNEIRPDIYIAVAENSGKYLEEVKPIIELNPVKYYQLTYERNSYAGVPKTSAMAFYFASATHSRDCLLPLAGVTGSDREKEGQQENSQKNGEQDSEGEETENTNNKKAETVKSNFEKNSKNYYAGQGGIKVTNKSQAMGMALFDDDKYVGKLGSIDAELYNILTGRMSENYVDFFSGSDKLPITIKAEEKRPPSYKIDAKNKMVDIKIKLECELESLPKEYENTKSIQDMEQEMSQMLTEAIDEFVNRMYKNDFDILGLRGKIKSKFATWQQYENYCKSYKNSDWHFNINSTVKIDATGIVKYR